METITRQFTATLIGILVWFVIKEFSPLAASSCSPILKQELAFGGMHFVFVFA
jgi:hypothetical protein